MRRQTNTVVQAMHADQMAHTPETSFMRVLAKGDGFYIGNYKTQIPVDGYTDEVYIFREAIPSEFVQMRFGGIGYKSLEDIKTLIPKIEKELADNARRLEATPNWILQEYADYEQPITEKLLNFLKSL